MKKQTNNCCLKINCNCFFFKSSLIIVLYSDAFTLHIKLARDDLEIIASIKMVLKGVTGYVR